MFKKQHQEQHQQRYGAISFSNEFTAAADNEKKKLVIVEEEVESIVALDNNGFSDGGKLARMCVFVSLIFVALLVGTKMYLSSRSSPSSPSSSTTTIKVPSNRDDSSSAAAAAAAAALSSSSSSKYDSSRPNIIFILTDDQGMGDMDIPGGDFENLMPTIRRMNRAGWNLTNYYSASLCTPARSQLMTGRYAVNAGMGHGVVMGTQPWGLPITEKLLPQFLQEAGYETHHIGKWHLGHYSKSHLPTARGFNSSFGYYGGYQHPSSYFYEWPGCSNDTGCLPDMHRNREVFSPDGQFNSYTFGDEAEKIIAAHAVDKMPFFLYLSPNLIHMPVHPDNDIMVEYEEELGVIDDIWRRRMGAMAIMLDDFVERVRSSLEVNSLIENSIIVYASDNGGQTEGSQMGAGSNYPLRGSKGSLYQGAVRVPAFIYSPILGHNYYSVDDDDDDDENDNEGIDIGTLFHVSDWLPTLLGGALGRDDLLSSSSSLALDGVDQWAWMLELAAGGGGLSASTDRSRRRRRRRNLGDSSGEEEEGEFDDYYAYTSSAPRQSVLLNVDPVTGISGLISYGGKWKLLLNESLDVSWYSGSLFGIGRFLNSSFHF